MSPVLTSLLAGTHELCRTRDGRWFVRQKGTTTAQVIDDISARALVRHPCITCIHRGYLTCYGRRKPHEKRDNR